MFSDNRELKIFVQLPGGSSVTFQIVCYRCSVLQSLQICLLIHLHDFIPKCSQRRWCTSVLPNHPWAQIFSDSQTSSLLQRALRSELESQVTFFAGLFIRSAGTEIGSGLLYLQDALMWTRLRDSLIPSPRPRVGWTDSVWPSSPSPPHKIDAHLSLQQVSKLLGSWTPTLSRPTFWWHSVWGTSSDELHWFLQAT